MTLYGAVTANVITGLDPVIYSVMLERVEKKRNGCPIKSGMTE